MEERQRPEASAVTIERLATELCAKAGVGRVSRVEPVALRSANANAVVTTESGARFVLRRYREQPPPHTALARLRRERWAHETLAARGAPVPRILAACEDPGCEAALAELVEGGLLGDAAGQLPDDAAAGAWAAAGRALASAHSVDADAAAAAGCERVGITRPGASRGPYHHDEALVWLERLGRSRPDLGPLDELTSLVELAGPLYARAPLALCQYDAHLWQFVVAPRRSEWSCAEWTCTGILDWEHADLDDPDWDLAQLDVFRFGPVGPVVNPVPPAFFAGYGRTPRSPLYVLYRIERAAYVLAARAEGEDWLEESSPLAERFLREQLGRADRLRRAIEVASR